MFVKVPYLPSANTPVATPRPSLPLNSPHVRKQISFSTDKPNGSYTHRSLYPEEEQKATVSLPLLTFNQEPQPGPSPLQTVRTKFQHRSNPEHAALISIRREVSEKSNCKSNICSNV
jgi:hypothetical protein